MKPGRSAILNLFILAASLLVVSVVVIYFVGVAAIESNQFVTSERSILQHLADFVSILKDAETGQRGYLLTGDEQYLDPYRQALDLIRGEQHALRRLAASGDLPAPSVETVIRLSEEKLAELDQIIQLRRASGLEPALANIRSGAGKVTMDKIRAGVAEMEAEEEHEIDQAQRRARAAVSTRSFTFLLATAFNLAFLAWVYRRISRESHVREAAVVETGRQKELLATTLASIGDGVIVTDAAGRVTFLNAEAERLTRWKDSEAANHPLPEVFRIVNEDTRQPAENPVEKVLRLGTVVGIANHTVLVAKDGTETPIGDSAAPIRQPGGPLFGVVLVFRDYSEQRKAEAARARLAAIVESSAEAIFSKSPEGKIQTWNAGAERLFGYRAEEIVGQSVTLLVPPDRLEEEGQILERLRRGQPSEQLETVRLAKDGRGILVSLSVSPLRDGEGRVVGASTIIHDITETVAARETLTRGRAELERLVKERTAELNEMVNELQHVSYAITHDMRAPLRAMGAFAQILLDESSAHGTSPEAEDYCRRILAAASRLDTLIHDALSYSGAVLQQVPMEPVDLSKFLRSLVDTYPNFHPEKADIQIESKLPVVLGNESLLTQCFSNLLGNAVKFVARGTRPQVRVWAETTSSVARIWIQDNGIGIPKQAQQRLFGMFQKLDNQYEGTGIGLAICRKVAERMGGKVGVESEPCQGSRFWVELPVAAG